MIQRLAITPGEPAGIGPDLCITLAQEPPPDCELVVFADDRLLSERALALGLPLTLRPWDPDAAPAPAQPGELSLKQCATEVPVTAGKLNKANAPYVVHCLEAATEAVQSGSLQALVTGPVQKSLINDAGIAFTGHTEFLAEQCQTPLTVMMLATEGLRVALATTHLALKDVPTAINRELLTTVLKILHTDLINKFGIDAPRILVCGLNPHAGESGHLGREEIDTIEPVVASLRDAGMLLEGPLPADTLFTPRHLDQADAVLAMYHDQGLPVLKFKGFGCAANITLGLPIIRTSVDHGTALDLAGGGKADSGSLYYAIAAAREMVRHWKRS